MDNYMTRERFEEIRKFASGKKTPLLVVSLSAVAQKYDDLKKFLPYADVYYAIKANPEEKILDMLAKRGSNFDVASIYELDRLLKLGVSPTRVSFGNTIKKAEHIRYAYEKGVRLFATDAESDVRKIAHYAPQSDVFVRIIATGVGADWPMSRKFGAHPDVVLRNIVLAKELGLNPRGVSFHVGSQQHDTTQWRVPISTCRELFDAAKEQGIRLDLVNIGGGFPSHYVRPVEETYVYAAEITNYMQEFFGADFPKVIIEPGRYMTGDAGVLVSEIVMISCKERDSGIPWLFLDAGKFGGLLETMDENVKYPIYAERAGEVNNYVIAGPTCDSVDVLYEKIQYRLPSSLEEGDRLYFFTTGAYTHTYSSVFFNGFPPLEAYVID
jgi:ornithine decarboxylase